MSSLPTDTPSTRNSTLTMPLSASLASAVSWMGPTSSTTAYGSGLVMVTAGTVVPDTPWPTASMKLTWRVPSPGMTT